MRSREVWRPIAPWRRVDYPSHLAEAYQEFQQYQSDEDRARLRERVIREWSIETGQIEGAFEIDRGITVQLVERGFVASLIGHQQNGLTGEQVQSILMDAKQALEGLFDFVRSEALTTSYVRQLHQQLMSSVSTYDAYYIDPVTNRPRLVKKNLEPGKYKEEPNNPWREDGSVEVYCPPNEVAEQMDSLVDMYNHYPSDVPVEQKAAWLHHAFTQIHPFQDGNGRVARALASLALIKGGLPPLTVYREMKARYIRCLEMADSGETVPLIAFFESCIYRQVVAAWHHLSLDNLAFQSSQPTMEEIIKAAHMKLAAKYNHSAIEWNVANTNVDNIMRPLIHHRFQKLAATLNASLSNVDSGFAASINQTRAESSMSVPNLEQWGQEGSDAGTLQAWTLTIKTASEASISVVTDSFSTTRKGLIGTAVVLKRGNTVWSPEPRFFHNFKEQHPGSRFEGWLDESLRQALARWQAGLNG